MTTDAERLMEHAARAMCRLHARYSPDHRRSDEDMEKFIDWHYCAHIDDVRAAITAIEASTQLVRDAAIEEAAKIADGGAFLTETGPELKYITARQFAADLAKDIADGIRSLSTPEGEKR